MTGFVLPERRIAVLVEQSPSALPTTMVAASVVMVDLGFFEDEGVATE
jgi:hypothetical protein